MAIEPADLVERILPPECRSFVPIGSVVDREIPQVSRYSTVADALGVLSEKRAAGALVVDGDRTPLGFVSAAGLAAANASQVEQVMIPVGIVLHENVPICIAASLMASMPADRIAIVGDQRRAIGLFGSADLVRWIASEAERSRA